MLTDSHKLYKGDNEYGAILLGKGPGTLKDRNRSFGMFA